jgi:hypothetical protein
VTSAFDVRQGEDYGFDDEADESSVAYGQGAAIDTLDAELDGEEESDDESYEEALALDDSIAMLAPDQPAAVSTAPLATELGALAGRQATGPAQGAVLNTFRVHYQAGIPDYDQSYSIMDPETGRYIGECGMGVNLKNGVLQNNPDSVIALDVWLVDKKQEKSYSSQSRVLFSEYVIDNKLEPAFTRERPNDAAPLVPQTGMSFQLKGPNLVLDCQVVEANYASNGPTAGIFQSVKIDLTVHSRE